MVGHDHVDIGHNYVDMRRDTVGSTYNLTNADGLSPRAKYGAVIVTAGIAAGVILGGIVYWSLTTLGFREHIDQLVNQYTGFPDTFSLMFTIFAIGVALKSAWELRDEIR